MTTRRKLLAAAGLAAVAAPLTALPPVALAVVEISHSLVDGNDLVYEYKLIEGEIPKSGGATALIH